MKKKTLSFKLLLTLIVILLVSVIGFAVYKFVYNPSSGDRCVLEGELCGYDYGECCGDLHCHPTDLNSAGKMYGVCGVGSNDRLEGESCGAEYIGCCGEGLVCIETNIEFEGMCFQEDSASGFSTVNEGKCF